MSVTVAILLKQQTMELLSCCLLSFAVEMDILIKSTYPQFNILRKKIQPVMYWVVPRSNDYYFLFYYIDEIMFIHAVGVNPSHRRKGIAQNLVDLSLEV